MPTLQTPKGPVEYTLTRKRVKNINVRIGPGGAVSVSAPMRCPSRDIEAFLREKSGWIYAHADKMRTAPARGEALYTKEQCMELFTQISERIFPLFADVLNGKRPEIRVRDMKTRWGVCYPDKRRITLNQRLAEKPTAAIEYVILHEYVHFLHPNHQAPFHAEMARLMPDYRDRKKLLRGG